VILDGPLILVVDDEPGVLAFVAAVLKRLKFTALTVGGGRAAVAVLSRHQPGDVAMVLLDVNMPGMDGPMTLAALRRIDAGLKCCFMSGGSIPYTPDHLLSMGATQILLKPFRPEGLATVIKTALSVVAC
jgi:two-component system OmpR family response regulator